MTRMLALLAVLTATITTSSAQDLATKGKEIYASQKCGVCHAVAGAGNKRGVLDGVGGKLSAADLRSWIIDAPAMTAKAKADRKPPMKSYTLPKDDLDALVAYLQTLK